MKISIIGAGNGGQAFAGYLSSLGHKVNVYDRNEQTVYYLNTNRLITLHGALECQGQINLATNSIEAAIKDTKLILITTTATAHNEIAKMIAPFLTDGQIIILNPGRTCGSLEFDNNLRKIGIHARYYLAETQTLVFACRLKLPGHVNIIGIKERVPICAFPSTDTEKILNILNKIFSCFYPVRNILEIGFENIGAIFHPSVVLFNEAAIERGQNFYFYRDMTPGLAHLIESADKERLAVANAYGVKPIRAKDWVSYAYSGVKGNTLCERMQNNPAYHDILAPTSIDCRQITEDIPTGILPMAELGRVAGVKTPVFDSLITLCSILMNSNYHTNGRTLKNLGLDNLTREEIIEKIEK